MALYLARFAGGPLGAQTLSVGYDWPLPDVLAMGEGGLRVVGSNEDGLDLTGVYVKVNESQLKKDMPGLVRGAEYQWRVRPVDG